MKIATACCFRHRPEQDGRLIPASRIEESGAYAGRTLPFLGYMVVMPPAGGKPFWSFVKYEAPEFHLPPKVCRPANFGTCRADILQCPDCGAGGPFPAERRHGGKPGVPSPSSKCPICGSRNCQRIPVKDGSEQFMKILGDLREPLLQEVEAAAEELRKSTADGVETFGSDPFPTLLVGAPSDAMSPDPDEFVPPAIQGLAQAHGRSFKNLSNTAWSDIPTARHGEIDVSIVPEIKVAGMELAEVRDGWIRTACCVSKYVRLSVPEPRDGAVVTGFRY